MFIVLRDFFYDLNMLLNNLLIYDCLLFSCFYLLLKFCKVLDFFLLNLDVICEVSLSWISCCVVVEGSVVNV